MTANSSQCRAAASGVVGKRNAGATACRFGSSLNMHLDVSILDGVVVVRDNEAPEFCRDRLLGKDELGELVERFAVRVVTRPRRHGFVQEEQDSESNGTCAFSFVEMLAQLTVGRGTFEKVEASHDDTQASTSEMHPGPRTCHGAARLCGFTSPRDASPPCCAKSKADAWQADGASCAEDLHRIDSAGCAKGHALLREDKSPVVQASRRTDPSVHTHTSIGACRLA